MRRLLELVCFCVHACEGILQEKCIQHIELEINIGCEGIQLHVGNVRIYGV